MKAYGWLYRQNYSLSEVMKFWWIPSLKVLIWSQSGSFHISYPRMFDGLGHEHSSPIFAVRCCRMLPQTVGCIKFSVIGEKSKYIKIIIKTKTDESSVLKFLDFLISYNLHVYFNLNPFCASPWNLLQANWLMRCLDAFSFRYFCPRSELFCMEKLTES